ncbi:MAG: RNA-binding protein [Nitrososphaeraceae archaeon]|mgnify:FL=1|jgi:translin|nr:RNA-binding protein [Nitrososphaeraceae archaeon]MDW0134706.1 RNA-binding protein [Nitrososphaeraceae archaeon]MDW0136458.1 RNA-binding protein [Nitrososphaeraceae archaeon]MDW0138476.1 RNA-binding protein [Nitrososphaeraceae archaeon]MDW0143166.1 RNA-binding protein [Nitrososphaeraceae archaeon]
MLSNVQTDVEEINKKFKDIEERRNAIIKGTRDATILCSKAIVSMHSHKKNESIEYIEKSKKLLKQFKELGKDDLQKYLYIAEQEFVEAYCLFSIAENSAIPGKRSLDVSDISYVMGLLDCIGEIKRMIIDKIRSEGTSNVTALFELMDKIYGTIYPLAVYDNLMPGLRKKLDVSRILIENVRAIITEEKRRTIMIEKIDEFEKKIMASENTKRE